MGERGSPGALLGSIKIYVSISTVMEIGLRDSGDPVVTKRRVAIISRDKEKKKEEEEEEEKTKWLLSKFCTLPIASIGFRFFVSTFVSLNFAGDKERGRVITGG